MTYGRPIQLHKNHSTNFIMIQYVYSRQTIMKHIPELKKRVRQWRFTTIVVAVLFVILSFIDRKRSGKIKFGQDRIDSNVISENRQMVDIISVGSLLKEPFQNAQEKTFGQHQAVRNFFRVTEMTDTDRECFTELTYDQLDDIMNFCTPENPSASSIAKRFRRLLFVPKKNAGWMCAQKRPIDGLNHVLKQYKETNMELPKYLFIIDDDTFINMDALIDMLLKDFSYEVPHLVAGCSFYYFMHGSMPYPYGGFGSFISRASIQRLIQPIQCADQSSDPFIRLACWRIKQNNMGEKHFFTDGMSVADLMHAFASRQPFSNATNWPNDAGYCFHSDHALAYFFNMYHIAVPDSALFDGFKFNDDLRDKYKYVGLHKSKFPYQEGECKNQYENCTVTNTVCHYIQPNQMLDLYREGAGTTTPS